MKKHEHWAYSFYLSYAHGNENDFLSDRMVYWKMSWFVHNFLQNFHMVPKVYALSRRYLDCLGYYIFFPFVHLYAKTVLWGL